MQRRVHDFVEVEDVPSELQEEAELLESVEVLEASADKMRAWGVVMRRGVDVLSRWLAHQYGDREQFAVLRQLRDDLRAALEK